MKLESRRKIAHDRCVAPKETISRLDALIRPHHDYWLHEEKVSDQLYWAAMFIDGVDFRAMGKGINAESSIAGALAEGAEWLTAQETGQLPGYLGARKHEVPNALPIESLVSHVASVTPTVLDQIRALDDAYHWVDGWSLIDEQPLKVPLEYARLVNGPSGKATGNHIEEAIIHATNEIFERRAHITVLRNRLVVPTIDPDTVRHPVIREQMSFFQSKNTEIILKDLSFGGELPCVAAYFIDHNIPEEYQFRHFFKVGAAFNREEALLRAFTEYAQGRRQNEFYSAETEDLDDVVKTMLDHDFRSLPSQPDDCDNFLSTFMFGFVPYRNADFLHQGEIVPFDPGQDYPDCLDDIDHARRICKTLGKDYVVIDLTDPEFGFPVAQVIIPGYSDVLPFHPADSLTLFKPWTRSEGIASYQNSK